MAASFSSKPVDVVSDSHCRTRSVDSSNRGHGRSHNSRG